MEKREIFKRFMLMFSIVGLIGTLICLIVYSDNLYGVGVICPFNEIWGFECPGCGATRTASCLLRLDFYQAFRYNPYVFIMFPVVLYVGIKQLYFYIFYNKLLKNLDIFLVFLILSFILFGIMRNFETFAWLKPTIISNHII